MKNTGKAKVVLCVHCLYIRPQDEEMSQLAASIFYMWSMVQTLICTLHICCFFTITLIICQLLCLLILE